jgi:hypothetical protein
LGYFKFAASRWRLALRERQDPDSLAHILVHNFGQKKTLVSTQNLENKGPEFFLPARSMVLKVVRGKILETLELRQRRQQRVPFWNRPSG